MKAQTLAQTPRPRQRRARPRHRRRRRLVVHEGPPGQRRRPPGRRAGPSEAPRQYQLERQGARAASDLARSTPKAIKAITRPDDLMNPIEKGGPYVWPYVGPVPPAEDGVEKPTVEVTRRRPDRPRGPRQAAILFSDPTGTVVVTWLFKDAPAGKGGVTISRGDPFISPDEKAKREKANREARDGSRAEKAEIDVDAQEGPLQAGGRLARPRRRRRRSQASRSSTTSTTRRRQASSPPSSRSSSSPPTRRRSTSAAARPSRRAPQARRPVRRRPTSAWRRRSRTCGSSSSRRRRRRGASRPTRPCIGT